MTLPMDDASGSCESQADFEKRVNPNDKGQQALLEEMRAHVKKVRSACSAHVKCEYFVHHMREVAKFLFLCKHPCTAVGGDAEE